MNVPRKYVWKQDIDPFITIIDEELDKTKQLLINRFSEIRMKEESQDNTRQHKKENLDDALERVGNEFWATVYQLKTSCVWIQLKSLLNQEGIEIAYIDIGDNPMVSNENYKQKCLNDIQIHEMNNLSSPIDEKGDNNLLKRVFSNDDSSITNAIYKQKDSDYLDEVRYNSPSIDITSEMNYLSKLKHNEKVDSNKQKNEPTGCSVNDEIQEYPAIDSMLKRETNNDEVIETIACDKTDVEHRNEGLKRNSNSNKRKDSKHRQYTVKDIDTQKIQKKNSNGGEIEFLPKIINTYEQKIYFNVQQFNENANITEHDHLSEEVEFSKSHQEDITTYNDTALDNCTNSSCDKGTVQSNKKETLLLSGEEISQITNNPHQNSNIKEETSTYSERNAELTVLKEQALEIEDTSETNLKSNLKIKKSYGVLKMRKMHKLDGKQEDNDEFVRTLITKNSKRYIKLIESGFFKTKTGTAGLYGKEMMKKRKGVFGKKKGNSSMQIVKAKESIDLMEIEDRYECKTAKSSIGKEEMTSQVDQYVTEVYEGRGEYTTKIKKIETEGSCKYVDDLLEDLENARKEFSAFAQKCNATREINEDNRNPTQDKGSIIKNKDTNASDVKQIEMDRIIMKRQEVNNRTTDKTKDSDEERRGNVSEEGSECRADYVTELQKLLREHNMNEMSENDSYSQDEFDRADAERQKRMKEYDEEIELQNDVDRKIETYVKIEDKQMSQQRCVTTHGRKLEENKNEEKKGKYLSRKTSHRSKSEVTLLSRKSHAQTKKETFDENKEGRSAAQRNIRKNKSGKKTKTTETNSISDRTKRQKKLLKRNVVQVDKKSTKVRTAIVDEITEESGCKKDPVCEKTNIKKKEKRLLKPAEWKNDYIIKNIMNVSQLAMKIRESKKLNSKTDTIDKYLTKMKENAVFFKNIQIKKRVERVANKEENEIKKKLKIVAHGKRELEINVPSDVPLRITSTKASITTDHTKSIDNPRKLLDRQVKEIRKIGVGRSSLKASLKGESTPVNNGVSTKNGYFDVAKENKMKTRTVKITSNSKGVEKNDQLDLCKDEMESSNKKSRNALTKASRDNITKRKIIEMMNDIKKKTKNQLNRIHTEKVRQSRNDKNDNNEIELKAKSKNTTERNIENLNRKTKSTSASIENSKVKSDGVITIVKKDIMIVGEKYVKNKIGIKKKLERHINLSCAKSVLEKDLKNREKVVNKKKKKTIISETEKGMEKHEKVGKYGISFALNKLNIPVTKVGIEKSKAKTINLNYENSTKRSKVKGTRKEVTPEKKKDLQCETSTQELVPETGNVRVTFEIEADQGSIGLEGGYEEVNLVKNIDLIIFENEELLMKEIVEDNIDIIRNATCNKKVVEVVKTNQNMVTNLKQIESEEIMETKHDLPNDITAKYIGLEENNNQRMVNEITDIIGLDLAIVKMEDGSKIPNVIYDQKEVFTTKREMMTSDKVGGKLTEMYLFIEEENKRIPSNNFTGGKEKIDTKMIKEKEVNKSEQYTNGKMSFVSEPDNEQVMGGMCEIEKELARKILIENFQNIKNEEPICNVKTTVTDVSKDQQKVSLNEDEMIISNKGANVRKTKTIPLCMKEENKYISSDCSELSAAIRMDEKETVDKDIELNSISEKVHEQLMGGLCENESDIPSNILVDNIQGRNNEEDNSKNNSYDDELKETVLRFRESISIERKENERTTIDEIEENCNKTFNTEVKTILTSSIIKSSEIIEERMEVDAETYNELSTNNMNEKETVDKGIELNLISEPFHLKEMRGLCEMENDHSSKILADSIQNIRYEEENFNETFSVENTVTSCIMKSNLIQNEERERKIETPIDEDHIEVSFNKKEIIISNNSSERKEETILLCREEENMNIPSECLYSETENTIDCKIIKEKMEGNVDTFKKLIANHMNDKLTVDEGIELNFISEPVEEQAIGGICEYENDIPSTTLVEVTHDRNNEGDNSNKNLYDKLKEAALRLRKSNRTKFKEEEKTIIDAIKNQNEVLIKVEMVNSDQDNEKKEYTTIYTCIDGEDTNNLPNTITGVEKNEDMKRKGVDKCSNIFETKSDNYISVKENIDEGIELNFVSEADCDQVVDAPSEIVSDHQEINDVVGKTNYFSTTEKQEKNEHILCIKIEEGVNGLKKNSHKKNEDEHNLAREYVAKMIEYDDCMHITEDIQGESIIEHRAACTMGTPHVRGDNKIDFEKKIPEVMKKNVIVEENQSNIKAEVDIANCLRDPSKEYTNHTKTNITCDQVTLINTGNKNDEKSGNSESGRNLTDESRSTISEDFDQTMIFQYFIQDYNEYSNIEEADSFTAEKDVADVTNMLDESRNYDGHKSKNLSINNMMSKETCNDCVGNEENEKLINATIEIEKYSQETNKEDCKSKSFDEINYNDENEIKSKIMKMHGQKDLVKITDKMDKESSKIIHDIGNEKVDKINANLTHSTKSLTEDNRNAMTESEYENSFMLVNGIVKIKKTKKIIQNKDFQNHRKKRVIRSNIVENAGKNNSMKMKRDNNVKEKDNSIPNANENITQVLFVKENGENVQKDKSKEREIQKKRCNILLIKTHEDILLLTGQTKDNVRTQGSSMRNFNTLNSAEKILSNDVSETEINGHQEAKFSPGFNEEKGNRTIMNNKPTEQSVLVNDDGIIINESIILHDGYVSKDTHAYIPLQDEKILKNDKTFISFNGNVEAEERGKNDLKSNLEFKIENRRKKTKDNEIANKNTSETKTVCSKVGVCKCEDNAKRVVPVSTSMGSNKKGSGIFGAKDEICFKHLLQNSPIKIDGCCNGEIRSEKKCERKYETENILMKIERNESVTNTQTILLNGESTFKVDKKETLNNEFQINPNSYTKNGERKASDKEKNNVAKTLGNVSDIERVDVKMKTRNGIFEIESIDFKMKVKKHLLEIEPGDVKEEYSPNIEEMNLDMGNSNTHNGIESNHVNENGNKDVRGRNLDSNIYTNCIKGVQGDNIIEIDCENTKIRRKTDTSEVARSYIRIRHLCHYIEM